MHIRQLLRRKGGDVATVDAAASVRTALALLAEHEVGALVVSQDGRHVDGIVSERDVVRALHERGAGLLADPIASVMTAQVHTCVPDAGVEELARTMTDLRIRHVPVVVDGRLTAIVSIGDIVKHRIDELQSERDQLVGYIQQ
jgi:CBS domain-containing protein